MQITIGPPVQVTFLEVRLAEVMAYADIPAHMRPALAEMVHSRVAGGASGSAGLALAASLSLGPAALARGSAPALQALQDARTAMLEALDALKSIHSLPGEAAGGWAAGGGPQSC